MSDFNPAYNKTMSHEGLYSFDPADLGGETWKGVSRKNFQNWPGWVIIDLLKLNVKAGELNRELNGRQDLENYVREFCRAEFWDKLKCSELKEQAIADELFDTAVNQGAGTAAKQLQTALNLLNSNGKHYADIAADGLMGAGTLRAYDAYMLTARFPGRSLERNINTLLKVLNGLQFMRYAEICKNNSAQEDFFYGWTNRI